MNSSLECGHTTADDFEGLGAVHLLRNTISGLSGPFPHPLPKNCAKSDDGAEAFGLN